MRSLRVAHVTPSYHPADFYGGPPASAYALSVALGALGHEVRALTTDANGPKTLAIETGVERALTEGHTARYERRIRRESTAPSVLTALPSYLAWADVVHLNAVYNFTTLPTLAGARVLDKPVVWSTRGALQGGSLRTRSRVKAVFEALARRSAPRRLVLHATSEAEATESGPFFPDARLEIIPNGVALPAEVPTRPAGRFVLGALGRLDPIKGLDRLLRALAVRRARGADRVQLLLAGGGDGGTREALEALARTLGLAADITFLGPVKGAAKTAFFAAVDALVAPSLRENFGLAIAEALAHGLPVIASRGTPWAALERERAGLWVDGEPDSLATAIDTLEHADRAAMGERGRAFVERELAWASIARRMTAVYERLLERSRGATG